MFGPKTQQGLGPCVLGGGGGGLGGLSGGTSGLGLGGELAWSTYFQHSCMYRIVEKFRGRKLSRISRFCGYTRKFSPRNLGCGVLCCCKSDQSAKVFSAKIVISPIHESFFPSKVPAIQYIYACKLQLH